MTWLKPLAITLGAVVIGWTLPLMLMGKMVYREPDMLPAILLTSLVLSLVFGIAAAAVSTRRRR